MNVLVLESSTSSSKMMVYSTETKESVIKSVNHENMLSTEKDSYTVITSLFNLCKNIENLPKIDAIIISSTWHNLLLCNKDMSVTEKSYYWNSNIANETVDYFIQDTKRAYKYYNKTGCVPHPQYPFFKLKHFRNIGKNISDYIITDIGSYIFYLLTGRLASSLSMVSGSGLVNLNSRNFDEEILNELNLSLDNLSVIEEDGYSLPLSIKGKELLGIAEDIPVFLAYPDGALNQVSDSNKDEDSMSFSIGTSAGLRIHQKEPKVSENFNTWCYISPYDYLVGGATSGASNTLQWIKNILFPDMDYDEILKKYNYKKEYPIFLPFLFNERSPSWDYKRTGSFAGLTGTTDPYDLYFSVVEGIVFNTLQTYQNIVEVSGEPEKIKLSGGFVNSEITAQLCADVFKREILLSDETQQSLMGGVKLVNEFKGYQINLDTMYKTLHPNKERKEVYQSKYKRYLTAYQRGKL